MTPTSPDRRPQGDEPLEELARDADEHNPEPTTRREAFELELEEQGRSDEGTEVEVTDVVDDDTDR